MADQPAAYHRTLPLTLEQIQGLCSERVYHQARAYVDSSHTITDRMRVQSRLAAKFHGTRGIYSTSLDLTTGELEHACDCPVGHGGQICKHVVALGLTWVREPESFHDLDVTLARLADASKAELLTLIRKIAGRMPDIVTLLDRDEL